MCMFTFIINEFWNIMYQIFECLMKRRGVEMVYMKINMCIYMYSLYDPNPLSEL